MDAFKIDAEAVLAAKCLTYTDDAEKQHHKAKADFLRLIESSMKKLVGLSNLTPEEVVDLKTLIVAKRVDFGTAVETWATDLAAALNAIKTQTEDLEVDPVLVEGMAETMGNKITLFEEEMSTNAEDEGDDEDSVIIWLETYFDGKVEELADTVA